MANDRFNTISLGTTINPKTDNRVISRLSDICGISKKKASLLLNNKKTIIKKQVDWKTASIYRKKLFHAGLATEIELYLNRSVFLESMVKKSETHNDTTPSSRSTYEYDAKTLYPLFFSPPGNILIKNSENKSSLKIIKKNYSISNHLISLITVFAILTSQHILFTINGQELTNIPAITTNILFAAITFFFLPSIIRIHQKIYIKETIDNKEHYITCKEVYSPNPFRREYHCHKNSITSMFFISQHKTLKRKTTLYRKTGEKIFFINDYKKTKEKNKYNKILRDTISKTNTKKISHKKILERDIEPSFVIKNPKNRPIAFLYKKEKIYIEIAAGQKEKYSLELILLFSIVCLNAES